MTVETKARPCDDISLNKPALTNYNDKYIIMTGIISIDEGHDFLTLNSALGL